MISSYILETLLKWRSNSCGSSAGTLCRSEEHTSELQSPVPISYAVFCLKKKKKQTKKTTRLRDPTYIT